MADSSRISVDDLKPMVLDASKQYGVPEDIIWGVIRAENSGSPKGAASLKEVSTQAISPKNARGVMQVTPIALQDVQQAGLVPESLTHDSLSVKDQINTGTAYLSRLLKLSQDPKEIYAMYNYGPKARFRMDQLPDETSNYVNKATGSESSVEKTGGGGLGTFGRGMVDSSDLVGQLFSTLKQQNDAIAQGGQQAQAAVTQSQDMLGRSIDAQRIVAAQAAETAAAKASVNYTVNSTIEGIQRLYNLDPSQVDNEIAVSLNKMNEARSAREPIAAEYDRLSSVDITKDPLGYLWAQIQLPAVAAKNNALARAEDTALQNINQRTQSLNAAKSTVTANTADQLKKIQLDQAGQEKQLADARLDAEQAKNLAGTAASRLQSIQIANMIGDNVRSTIQTTTALEDRKESLELRKAQKDEVLSAKKLKDEDDARLNARLKTVSDSLGMVEPMTTSRLRTLQDKKSQEVWLNAALTGQFGDDLNSSVEFYLSGANRAAVQNAGGGSVYTTAQKLEREGAGYTSTAERAMMAANPLGKKPDQKVARTTGYKMYQDEVVSSMASGTDPQDLSSSTWDTKYNPYKAQFLGFNKTIDTDPKLASLKNNLVTNTVRDMISTGVVKSDNLTSDQQQQVIKAISEQVKERKVLPQKAAADIAAYFKSAATYNEALNKYSLFGLPPQTNYMFTLNGSWPTNSRDKVDLFDAASVENKLIKVARGGTPVGIFNDPSDYTNIENPFRSAK